MSEKQKNRVVSLAISIVILIANSWHVITQWAANPRGRFFTWIAHYYADYFLYVSSIAQGIRGNWIYSKTMYTNETLPDSWLYWPNVLIGKIGSVISTSPFILYSLSLVLFVALLLFLLYTLTRLLFPKQPQTQLVAFLFCTTASNFANIPALFTKGEFSLTNEMWFSPTPALNRFGGVPHQTLQTILLILVVVLAARLMQPITVRKRIVLTILFAFIAFISATLSPIQMLIACAAIGVSCVFQKLKFLSLVSIGIGLLASAFAAFLVNHTFDTSVLNTFAKSWEASQNVTATSIDLLFAMGPIILFLPFGIRRFLKQKTPIRLILFFYGFMSLGIFGTRIPHLLGTSPTRWIHPASCFVWYGIAAEGVYAIAHQRPKASRLVLFILMSFYLFFTLPAILAQIHARSSKASASTLYSDVNHVPQHVVSALTSLASFPNTDVVLTDPILPYDGLVPIFTGKRSFTGHPIHTLYPQTKEQLRQQFFLGKMDEQTARQFLSDHSIRYVIASTFATTILPPYSFLTSSYKNEAITIYETKQ